LCSIFSSSFIDACHVAVKVFNGPDLIILKNQQAE
jgi:hypothetical protein